jgi:chemotaxis protein methyltransferase CheR
MVALDQFDSHLEDIEIHLLLEGIYRHYGFDFRNYAQSSLKRRVWNFVRSENLSTISSLQERVLHDRQWLDRFLYALSVNVSAMFRDPVFYIAFRNDVVPLLRTYPFIRIWLVGVSQGEEVYSLSILLQEEGIYDRCRIYATDINDSVLKKAKAGIYPLELMQQYTSNVFEILHCGLRPRDFPVFPARQRCFRPAQSRDRRFLQRVSCHSLPQRDDLLQYRASGSRSSFVV